MQRNKIYAVKTLAVVAREIGEDEDWIGEVVAEMEPEDGVIRVFGIDERCIIAFFRTTASKVSRTISVPTVYRR